MCNIVKHQCGCKEYWHYNGKWSELEHYAPCKECQRYNNQEPLRDNS